MQRQKQYWTKRWSCSAKIGNDVHSSASISATRKLERPSSRVAAHAGKILLALIVMAAPIVWYAYSYDIYSNGFRVGIVTKFSEKGVIWKTWEGEMNLGGTRTAETGRGRTNITLNLWEFSLDNQRMRGENLERLKSILLEAQDSGKSVKVQCTQEVFVAPWRADTTYVIQDVTVEQ